MQEIKFRGKLIDNGEWVYGSYVKIEKDSCFKQPNNSDSVFRERHYIISELEIDIVSPGYADSGNEKLNFITFEVDPKTVGQFTGLEDKAKVEIYANDIIEMEEPIMESDMIQCRVIFYEGAFVAEWDRGSQITYFQLSECHLEEENVEIIGSTHDNPELLTS